MGALAGAVESIWAIFRALLAGRKAPRNCKVALVRVFNPAKSSFMFPTKALAAPLERDGWSGNLFCVLKLLLSFPTDDKDTNIPLAIVVDYLGQENVK